MESRVVSGRWQERKTTPKRLAGSLRNITPAGQSGRHEAADSVHQHQREDKNPDQRAAGDVWGDRVERGGDRVQGQGAVDPHQSEVHVGQPLRL
jgi:hypothetical protein